MKRLIAEMIPPSKGYCYETAGMLIVFLNDTRQARACAEQIAARSGRTAEVCGSRIAVFSTGPAVQSPGHAPPSEPQ